MRIAGGAFAVRTGKRIAAIIVATQGVELADHASGDWNGDGVADYLNRRYTLDYSASPFWSELHSVTLTGCREESDSRVTTFSYTSAAPEGTQAIEVIGASGFPGHLMDKDWVDFIDFNADGAPDILRTDPNGAGPHTVFLNAGESVGEAGPVVAFGEGIEVGGDRLAWNLSLSPMKSSVAHLADMDGDGLSDLVYRTGVDAYVFANVSSGSAPAWGGRRQLNIGLEGEAPPSPFAVEHVETMDVDGDKRMDIIQSVRVGEGAYYRIWCNRGEQGFAEGVTVPQGLRLYAFRYEHPAGRH